MDIFDYIEERPVLYALLLALAFVAFIVICIVIFITLQYFLSRTIAGIFVLILLLWIGFYVAIS